MRGTRVLIGMAAVLFSGIAAVHAQDQDPSARVARTSFLQGDVSFRPGTVDDWTSATLNYPLTSGDHLWTDANARAELHIGPNAIRLAPETAFEILALDDNRLQIRLTQGSALIRMRTLDVDDNVEIDTPTGAVTLLRDGTYRVDVSADGATSTVTARNGDAEVTSNDQLIDVRPYETVLFTADGASQDVRDAPPMDEYDQWAAARDRAEDQSESARYVSRDMTGYEDLDRNGTWSDDPSYGHIWIPSNVASDWAPYRYGRWVWIEPYGWTWIDDAPWGFAPFHYGRWAYARDRWVWVPGAMHRHAVYAPALVVFVGGDDDRDSRWDGRRNVGWFPLAPNEVYRPAYHASDRYVRRVNVTNVNVTNINVTNINVTNIQYRNQRVNGAVTAVPQDQFANSRRIGRGATILPVEQARYAHIVGESAPVTPTKQSVLIGKQNGAVVSRPPEDTQRRRVVWRNTPPAGPATFASHEDQLKTTGDTPVAPLPISETRGAPRTPITRPNINVHQYPAADQPRPDSNVGPKPAPNANDRSIGRRFPITQPNTNARPVPTPRPNVNVRAPEAQPDASARTPEPKPDVNVRAPEADVNVRPAPVPDAHPKVNERPTPRERPNTAARPMPHGDDPSPPVSGSPNASPAHTVDPNTDVRSVPRARPAQAPREEPRVQPGTQPSAPADTRRASHSDVQPNERPAPQARPRIDSEPARRQGDDRPANGRRGDRGDDKVRGKSEQNDKAKQDQDDKPPRQG